MRDYKYDYTIAKENSPAEFKSICKLLEKKMPDYDMKKLLVDVDGTTIQVFVKGDTEVVVYDDYDIGSVFIKSDIDLSGIIENKKAS